MITLTLNSFYIVTAIVIILCIIYILFFAILLPLINKNKVKKELLNISEKTKNTITIENFNDEGCTWKIKINEKYYYVKLIHINKNCDLQINNFDTWVAYKKTFPNDALTPKVLDNLTEFMKSKLENRIVILSQQAKTIKKVINECEMIMVNPNTNVYGINIINLNNLLYLFEKQ